MSRARHHEKKRAKGGAMKEHAKPEWEAGGSSNAAKEAEERKHGGHVGEGEKPHHGAHKRARGGHVEEPHHAVKEKSMHHRHGMRVPGRKRGGGVGADMHPLTTAANIKKVVKGEYNEGEPESD